MSTGMGGRFAVLLAAPVLLVVLVASAGAGAASVLFGTSGLADCQPTAGITPGGPVPGSNAAVVVAGYTGEQLANAATIVAVGRQLAVPVQGWVVAVTAALRESGLRNLDHGDRDSLGLFQQRPSQGWGTRGEILNPAYAATAFYRHLLAVPGWQQMSVNDAAQAVQRSGFPDAYAAHEHTAWILIAAVGPVTCTALPPSGAAAGTAIAFARGVIGTPYQWGGNGPPNDFGYDCSGLVKAAYAAAGIILARTAQQQYDNSLIQPVSAQPRPGDLVFYGTPTRIHHVGLYIGGGQMIDAPDFGLAVTVEPFRWPGDDYAGFSDPTRVGGK